MKVSFCLLVRFFASFIFLSCTTASVLFGFTTPDASYISTSASISHSGVTIRNDFDWVREIDGSLVGIQGEVSDCEELFSILRAKTVAHSISFDGRSLPCNSIAHLCQTIISQRLRTEQRLNVNILIAGWDKDSGADGDTMFEKRENQRGIPKLYWLDDIGSLQDVKYASHGAETMFMLSMLDQWSGGRKECANILPPPLSVALNTMKGNDPQLISSSMNTQESSVDTTSTVLSPNKLHDNDSITETVPSSVHTHSVGLFVKQCWLQLQKRSKNRIDLQSVRLHSIDPSGCKLVSLEWSVPQQQFLRRT